MLITTVVPISILGILVAFRTYAGCAYMITFSQKGEGGGGGGGGGLSSWVKQII